jgi:hypothetical protein
MRLRRRWTRWIQTQREAYTEFRLRHRREARERREERHQMVLETEATKLALARSMLERLDWCVCGSSPRI